MITEMPPFWWEGSDWRAVLLTPLALVYGTVARARMELARPPRAPIPVLCVGNLTVGGAGKTPVAIALAAEARRAGHKPGFLTRGYGGSGHIHRVDPAGDRAMDSGDEPLLLARHAPVAVAVDRLAGIRLLMEAGCDFAIMDDGFQSARLQFDFALVVVDGHRGIGNGHVIPAGPLRAPLYAQLRRADAVLTVGSGDGAVAVVRAAARAGKPVFAATTRVIDPARVSGRRFLAFAGIGHPEKFFDTLEAAGAEIAVRRPYADHFPYRDDDIRALTQEARAKGLELITTAKDAVRFANGTPAALALLEQLNILEIEIAFEPQQVGGRIIADTMMAFRKRMFA